MTSQGHIIEVADPTSSLHSRKACAIQTGYPITIVRSKVPGLKSNDCQCWRDCSTHKELAKQTQGPDSHPQDPWQHTPKILVLGRWRRGSPGSLWDSLAELLSSRSRRRPCFKKKNGRESDGGIIQCQPAAYVCMCTGVDVHH